MKRLFQYLALVVFGMLLLVALTLSSSSQPVYADRGFGCGPDPGAVCTFVTATPDPGFQGGPSYPTPVKTPLIP